MCVKRLSMRLCCIFSARGAKVMPRPTGSSGGTLSIGARPRTQEGKRPHVAPISGIYPDISQQSFHNSSIFTRRSITKLVSFRETFQDEIAK